MSKDIGMSPTGRGEGPPSDTFGSLDDAGYRLRALFTAPGL